MKNNTPPRPNAEEQERIDERLTNIERDLAECRSMMREMLADTVQLPAEVGLEPSGGE